MKIWWIEEIRFTHRHGNLEHALSVPSWVQNFIWTLFCEKVQFYKLRIVEYELDLRTESLGQHRHPVELEPEEGRAYLPPTAIDQGSLICPADRCPNSAHFNKTMDIKRSGKLKGQQGPRKRVRTPVEIGREHETYGGGYARPRSGRRPALEGQHCVLHSSLSCTHTGLFRGLLRQRGGIYGGVYLEGCDVNFAVWFAESRQWPLILLKAGVNKVATNW